jgi:hypothetical protein
VARTARDVVFADGVRCSRNEVVTGALVRDVELPGGAGTMALITLDNGRDHTPGRARSARPGCSRCATRWTRSRLAPTSPRSGSPASPFIFAVGAGLSGVPLITARDEALAIARLGHEVFAAEDEALADLLLSEELRAGLYAFDLTQKRARHAAGAPDPSLARPVTKVGVVGAGLMASQIALLFARRLEVPVVLTDLDQARLDAGLGHVRAEVDRLRQRGRISADTAARLTALVTGSLTKDAFAEADFVIEAVFEEMAVKQRVRP